MLESVMEQDQASVSMFGFTRPRATVGRLLLALAASLVLGFWLSGMLFSGLMVVGKMATQNGWTNQNLYNLPNQPSSEALHQDPAYQAQAQRLILFLGSSPFVFTAVLFVFCCYRTRTAANVFFRLKWVFGGFIIAYLFLAYLWSQLSWERNRSVLDVSTDSIIAKCWLFAILGLISFFWERKNLRSHQKART